MSNEVDSKTESDSKSKQAIKPNKGVSMLEDLTKELATNPKAAVEFFRGLSRITKSWELIGSDGVGQNEVSVPQGQSAKDFLKKQTQGAYVSGYRLSTIFGDEIALITKDTPKWRILILGEYQTDAPFIQHSQKAEATVKEFVEEKLMKMGYIIG